MFLGPIGTGNNSLTYKVKLITSGASSHVGKEHNMSLNQQYTWKDFLKEHPEHKEKGLKRTSSEGKKAFESAFKAHAKKHLEGRVAHYEKSIETAKKLRTELVSKVKIANEAEKKIRVKQLNSQIGRVDAAVARHGRQIESAKASQKNLK